MKKELIKGRKKKIIDVSYEKTQETQLYFLFHYMNNII